MDEPEELNNEPEYYVEGKVFRGVKLQYSIKVAKMAGSRHPIVLVTQILCIIEGGRANRSRRGLRMAAVMLASEPGQPPSRS